jgi:hypothetical protein
VRGAAWGALVAAVLAAGFAGGAGRARVSETAPAPAVPALAAASGAVGAYPPEVLREPDPWAVPTAAEAARLQELIAPWLPGSAPDLPAGTPGPLPEPASGWLPAYRIVAYYGNPLAPAMGVLGQYPPQEAMARLQAQAAAYAQADPSVPVIPAIELVADVAQGSPGPQGLYRLRMSPQLLDSELALARRNRALLILDLQVGRSTVQRELPYFLPWLSQPDVMLALDPEFDMPPGDVPGQEIGTMSAADIDWAVQDMSALVARLGLPPKIVIVHQFLPSMVTDWRAIHGAPGVQFVMDTDGFGGQGIKLANYRSFITDQPIPPVRYGGIKLFYKYDVDLMTPSQVVALQPPPSLVIYQ